ncbi:MAG: hypothetical protein EBW84_02375 [Betaproteobacteria bacterium]|nr:hypothetical protein [Betaproteobacteria bacterium]
MTTENNEAALPRNLFGLLTDVDGTLTQGGQLLASTYQALWSLHQSGLKIIPVTGRSAAWGQGERMAIHDAVAVLHLAIPDLVGVARYRVTIDATSGPARGRTIGDASPYRLKRDHLETNCDVGLTIDPVRFADLVVEAYAQLP